MEDKWEGAKKRGGVLCSIDSRYKGHVVCGVWHVQETSLSSIAAGEIRGCRLEDTGRSEAWCQGELLGLLSTRVLRDPWVGGLELVGQELGWRSGSAGSVGQCHNRARVDGGLICSLFITHSPGSSKAQASPPILSCGVRCVWGLLGGPGSPCSASETRRRCRRPHTYGVAEQAHPNTPSCCQRGCPQAPPPRPSYLPLPTQQTLLALALASGRFGVGDMRDRWHRSLASVQAGGAAALPCTARESCQGDRRACCGWERPRGSQR